MSERSDRAREEATAPVAEERRTAPVGLEREVAPVDRRDASGPTGRWAGGLPPVGQGQRRWVRRGLVGLGVLAPVAALAVPGVRRPLARAWQGGAAQVADAARAGK